MRGTRELTEESLQNRDPALRQTLCHKNPFKTVVRVCKRCAPRSVQVICCFLTNRRVLVRTSSTPAFNPSTTSALVSRAASISAGVRTHTDVSSHPRTE